MVTPFGGSFVCVLSGIVIIISVPRGPDNCGSGKIDGRIPRDLAFIQRVYMDL